MSLQQTLLEAVAISQSGLWVRSDEHEDFLAELAKMSRKKGWRLLTWDCDQYLFDVLSNRAVVPQASGPPNPLAGNPMAKPIGAVRAIAGLPADDVPHILAIRNLHLFLEKGSQELLQAIQRLLVVGKTNNRFLIALATPGSVPPLELQPLMKIIEHELPAASEFEVIINRLVTGDGKGVQKPTGQAAAKIYEVSRGLTRLQAENCYALSLARHSEIRPDVIWQEKVALLNAEGLVTPYEGKETFADLGGLDAAKDFLKTLLLRPRHSHPEVRPKGVMFTGVPGSGKTAIAKALGTEITRLVVMIDVGRLMGGLVGDSERNQRNLFRLLRAMAPVIAVIDEVEKVMPKPGAEHDSGVGSRLTGGFLTFMNDVKEDVFWVCTANDITQLHEAFTRAERFDNIFYVGLPGRGQKDAIWHIYTNKFGLEDKEHPDDEQWTGAEIKSCCRLAALLGCSLKEAAQNVVPVATRYGDKIAAGLEWARGRCIDAESGMRVGMTNGSNHAAPTQQGRRVTRLK